MRLLIVGVFCVCLTAQSVPTPEGDALFDKQDWAGAARAFKSAAENNPQDGRIWFRLAASLHRTGDYMHAADAFKKAAELQFQAPQAMAGVAREYATAKQPGEALAWLEKAANAGFGGVAFIDSDPSLSSLKTDAKFAAVHQRVYKNSKPCETDPEYRKFDFWVGEWDVKVSGQVIAKSRIEKIDEGCVILENWMPFLGIPGKSWNFYDSETGKWEQIWDQSGSIHRYEGNLDGSVMKFHGVMYTNGKKTDLRLAFTPNEDHSVRQLMEQSNDGGKTWAVSFDGMYVPGVTREQPISNAERQELLDHLRRSQKAYADELRGLTPAQARYKPSPDRWSIMECAEHLAQAEMLLFNDAIDGLKLPPGGKSTATEEAILKAWGTRAQKVQASGDYLPTGRWPDLAAIESVFDDRRARTIEFVVDTQADLRGRICCGNLDIWQQLLGLSAHTLRHVQQMEDVKADPGFPK